MEVGCGRQEMKARGGEDVEVSGWPPIAGGGGGLLHRVGPRTLGGARGEGGLQATRPHSWEEGAVCTHGHTWAAVQMADGSEPAKPL